MQWNKNKLFRKTFAEKHKDEDEDKDKDKEKDKDKDNSGNCEFTIQIWFELLS